MVNYTQKPQYDLNDFREIVAILRHPGGCPWDMVQTHQTIRRDLLEETAELAEAIDTENLDLMKEELGDVLMQVLFHAGIEEDAGHFDINDVADYAAKKMIYRHPHVFGDVQVSDLEEELNNWDALKRKEKNQSSYTDVLNAVARTLPATWRAEKVTKKAAKAGFDWPKMSDAIDKVEEEFSEVKEAIAEGDQAHISEEIGDLLFAAVSLARWNGVDPEAALHATTEKFIRRFALTESALEGDMKEHTIEEMLAAYRKAKETAHE
ncbi:MAG: nucleoside triphosphate pyrophosphohydrolase [Oscillospiraceae bacterium]|nr:nucleoside triphosphate pyrophosphohydrolase [Oscillospiraceae bacterium]